MRALYSGDPDPTAIGLVKRGGTFADFHPATKQAETSWPISADADYFQRPPTGVFYFRDYAGNLLNQNMTDINDLRLKMANRIV